MGPTSRGMRGRLEVRKPLKSQLPRKAKCSSLYINEKAGISYKKFLLTAGRSSTLNREKADSFEKETFTAKEIIVQQDGEIRRGKKDSLEKAHCEAGKETAEQSAVNVHRNKKADECDVAVRWARGQTRGGHPPTKEKRRIKGGKEVRLPWAAVRCGGGFKSISKTLPRPQCGMAANNSGSRDIRKAGVALKEGKTANKMLRSGERAGEENDNENNRGRTREAVCSRIVTRRRDWAGSHLCQRRRGDFRTWPDRLYP